MAKKADVDFALQGEQQKQEGRSIEDSIINDINNDNETLSQVKYYVFKLVNNTRKGGVYLPNIDDVLNPETGKVERMRLLSGISSVWLKDQEKLTPEYVRNNGRSPHFIRGTRLLQVPEHDETMLTFMRLSSHNIGSKSKKAGSPYSFYEYDAALEEKRAFEKEDFEIEMAIKAKGASVEEMKKHASFLGIRMVNEATGEPKSADGIRREYVMSAKRSPDYFKQTLGTPQIEIAWLVKRAIAESLIEIGREPGKIFWANGGGMIAAIPQGENAQDYLTNLAETNNEEGVRFKEQLKKVST